MEPRAAAWLSVGLAVAMLLSVAARGAVHASRTGSMGVRLPSGAGAVPGYAAAAIGWVGAVAYVLAVVMQIRERWEPWFLSWASVGSGVALVLAGTVLSVAGQATMGASWRAGVDESERTELVRKGLFARSRNPIYAGLFMSTVGLALLVPNWLSLAAVMLSVAGAQVQVRLAEEPYLLRVHGDSYREYAGRVGRFVPGIGRGVGS